MIRTIDIPSDRWVEFVKMMNRVADGRPVRLEVARRDLGDQELAQRLQLDDIDFEQKGSERGKLVIVVGSDRGELTHVVEQPTRIAVGLNSVDEPQWIAIEEAGGATTVVHFERLPPLERSYGDVAPTV